MTAPIHRYSARVGEALTLAAVLHAEQPRKGTSIPYVSHLVAVAALVMEDGGDENDVIAALLHDAVEDQGGTETAAVIREQFGDQVADVVIECSDAAPEAGDEKPPWHERKRHHLAGIADMSASALRVSAADKLHNVQSTLSDVRRYGTSVWDRFKTGREGFLWYHNEVLAVLLRRTPDSRSVQRLSQALEELAGIS